MIRYISAVLSVISVLVTSFYLGRTMSFWEFVITGTVLIISYGLFSALGSGYSLAIAVTEVLTLGFTLVFNAWFTNATTTLQTQYILVHLSLTATIILLWLNAQYVRQLFLKNIELGTFVKSLQKRDDVTGILTLNELLYRFEDIWTGLKRRNETGYLLEIIVPNSITYSQSAILSKVSQAALLSIRNHYDIVGSISDHVVCIVLQNTSSEGVRAVQERFKQQLSKNLSPDVIELLEIKQIKIDLDIPNGGKWFKSMLTVNLH